MRPTRQPAPQGMPRIQWQTLKTFLPYVFQYKWRVGVAIVLLIGAKVATVSTPLVLKEIINQLDANQNTALILPVALLITYGALRFSGTLFRELRNIIFARVRYGIMRQIATRVVSHLHALSLRYHLERQTGALSRDINRGTTSISTVLNYLLFNIFPTLLEIAMVSIILFTQYSGWFALVAVLTFIAYIAFTLKMTEWRIKFRSEANKTESNANTQAIDALLNYETVKYFGNETYEVETYADRLKQWENAGTKSLASMGLLNLGQGFIISCGVTGIMLLAGAGVADRTLTLGDLVAVNAFLLQLFLPLGFLGTIYSILKNAFTDMERMMDLLEQTPEVQDRDNAATMNVSEGHVRFEDVRFAYDEEREILHGISFDIPAGQTVALVGASGSGKSTTAKLLFRFYDPTDGLITIDGQDIREVSQHSLRQHIGVVPQDTVLFNETLGYNIHYADLNATQEEVERAVQMAALDEFIEALPQGMDTIVGERGLKLSGGEKQRVAIARAILKQPRVMIFDEATSSLDSNAEQAILSALGDVAQGRTTLIIAHRLSTIIDANQIIVLDHGEIIERGTHEELLAMDGRYAQMWSLQQDTTQHAA